MFSCILFLWFLLVYPPAQHLEIEPPPLSYDHPPIHQYVEFNFPAWRVNEICNLYLLGPRQYGCARTDANYAGDTEELLYNPAVPVFLKVGIQSALRHDPYTCIIFIPHQDKEITQLDKANITRHELAHCNGVVHNSKGRGWYLLSGRKVAQDAPPQFLTFPYFLTLFPS